MEYILLRCGLSNRLRTMVAFMYIMDHTSRRFEFHWDMHDSAINGKLCDVFNCEVRIKYCAKNPRLHYTFIGQDIIFNILRDHAPHLLPLSDVAQFIKKIEMQYYRRFKWKHYIRRIVDRFCAQRAPIAAIHVRRTDHVAVAQANSAYTTYAEFDAFISQYPRMCVFLSTDCRDVQLKYTECMIYKVIKPSANLRQTSLVDAVIDIGIASRCKEFMGSKYSSFSHLITIFAAIEAGVGAGAEASI